MCSRNKEQCCLLKCFNLVKYQSKIPRLNCVYFNSLKNKSIIELMENFIFRIAKIIGMFECLKLWVRQGLKGSPHAAKRQNLLAEEATERSTRKPKNLAFGK